MSDLVLVYGERSVFDPVTTYRFPPPLAARTRFCGYIVNRDEADCVTEPIPHALLGENRSRPVVLATTGGGEDGFLLLQAFARAAAGAPWDGILVTGPMTSGPELKTLRRLAAEANVTLGTFVPNLSRVFQSIDALVCMGGYNTLVEGVSRGVPAVCVPRTSLRSDQLLRARAFERLDLLSVLEPEKLDPQNLKQVIEKVIGTSRKELLARVRASLHFDGAHTAAEHLLALATSELPAAPDLLDRLAG